MDGYTFMIERNRLLIQFEAEHGQPGSAAAAAGQTSGPEDELRKDLMALYKNLEACGRAGEPAAPPTR